MLGYTSMGVNDQLVNVAPNQAFDPLTFGQAYTGPARWPRQGVYNVPPVLPSASLRSNMPPELYGSSYADTSAMSETGNPFSVKKSPLWWALGFLIVGMLMLQYVHYGKG